MVTIMVLVQYAWYNLVTCMLAYMETHGGNVYNHRDAWWHKKIMFIIIAKRYRKSIVCMRNSLLRKQEASETIQLLLLVYIGL